MDGDAHRGSRSGIRRAERIVEQEETRPRGEGLRDGLQVAPWQRSLRTRPMRAAVGDDRHE